MNLESYLPLVLDLFLKSSAILFVAFGIGWLARKNADGRTDETGRAGEVGALASACHSCAMRNRDPEQQTIAPRAVGGFKKYTITAVAAFAMEAKVKPALLARGHQMEPGPLRISKRRHYR